ncbi:unnamed protein product [Oikopleura dioica]|uniref:Hexosyltransferase n=1 Tax=Oikopleura dioica TaxID=34765 RepID=E4YCC3_OIKDI|nr:unnamed protein product [Oikopleura dioica]
MMPRGLTRCKGIMPTILGLTIGLALSFLRAPVIEPDECRIYETSLDSANEALALDNSVPAFPASDEEEDFEPQIIVDPKLKPKVDLEANKKKVVRSRYISTELGIRERLVSSMITSKDTVSSLAIAQNKTLGHHMQKLLFFFGSHEQPFKGKNHQPAGMNIVVHPEEDEIRILYQTLYYLYQHYNEVYDWFFVGYDNSYVAGYRVNEIVNHMSITRKLYLGLPARIHDEKIDGYYCKQSAGFIMSRALMMAVMPEMNKCLSGIQADSPDEWLGRCLLTLTKGEVGCVNTEEVQTYESINLENDQQFDVETASSKLFEKAVSAFPVATTTEVYKLHKRFSEVEIDMTYRKIEFLQEEIKNLSAKTPQGEDGLSWPIGVNPPFQPSNRWEVINWDYFDSTHTLTCPGEIPKCELSDMEKKDVHDIVATAVSRLQEKYKPQNMEIDLIKLENGYKRFDPQRGMEYMLDLKLRVTVDSGQTELSHRVDLLRPLSQVEIIPMPYVTETTKINMILPVSVDEAEALKVFLDKFEKKVLMSKDKDSILLTIIFIYGAAEAEKVHQKDDPFTVQKERLGALEVKYGSQENRPKVIPWMSIKTDIPSQLRILDVIVRTKKFTADSLFFLASPHADVNNDLFDRCRMNAIAGWQAYFPVPFTQFNKEIAPDVKEEIEIKGSTGHFDIYSFDETCFFNSDYMAARSKFAQKSQKNQDLIDNIDLYELFMENSELHVFRAVEPALKRRWMLRQCSVKRGDGAVDRCERSNAEGLGTRTQLAMKLFPDET